LKEKGGGGKAKGFKALREKEKTNNSFSMMRNLNVGGKKKEKRFSHQGGGGPGTKPFHKGGN